MAMVDSCYVNVVYDNCNSFSKYEYLIVVVVVVVFFTFFFSSSSWLATFQSSQLYFINFSHRLLWYMFPIQFERNFSTYTMNTVKIFRFSFSVNSSELFVLLKLSILSPFNPVFSVKTIQCFRTIVEQHWIPFFVVPFEFQAAVNCDQQLYPMCHWIL